jgi:hypothetical protein
VVHGAATLSIILVVDGNVDDIGLLELIKWGCMGQDVPILKESCILVAELDCTSFDAS